MCKPRMKKIIPASTNYKTTTKTLLILEKTINY